MKNLKITVNGITYDVQVEEIGGAVAPAAPIAVPAVTAPAAPAAPVATPAAAPAAAPAVTAAPPAGAETIKSPMPGTILAVNIKTGDSVKKGQVLLILEAMKMENEIMSPTDATVVAVHVSKGDSADTGTPLVSLK